MGIFIAITVCYLLLDANTQISAVLLQNQYKKQELSLNPELLEKDSLVTSQRHLPVARESYASHLEENVLKDESDRKQGVSSSAQPDGVSGKSYFDNKADARLKRSVTHSKRSPDEEETDDKPRKQDTLTQKRKGKLQSDFSYHPPWPFIYVTSLAAVLYYNPITSLWDAVVVTRLIILRWIKVTVNFSDTVLKCLF